SVNVLDSASLEVLGDVARAGHAGGLLIARLPTGAKVPTSLLHGVPPLEFMVPNLSNVDAQFLAHAILAGTTPDDVCRQVAALGGQSSLGIEEAARALVRSGDLFHNGKAFVWRSKPRRFAQPASVEALLQERLLSLKDTPYQVLQILSILPESSSLSFLET